MSFWRLSNVFSLISSSEDIQVFLLFFLCLDQGGEESGPY